MKSSLFIFVSLFCFAFMLKTSEKAIVFKYPKKKGIYLTLTSDKFKKFSEEWRGQDYYYMSQGESGFICSVLFYKLTEKEVQKLVEAPRLLMNGPEKSPVYPLTYFSTYSNTKSMESNEENWGSADSTFMFRQVDIKELSGMKINQKNFYAYGMLDKDVFIKVHLSKVACSQSDSFELRKIAESIKLVSKK